MIFVISNLLSISFEFDFRYASRLGIFGKSNGQFRSVLATYGRVVDDVYTTTHTGYGECAGVVPHRV